jgi:CheY-like chemotaxis protein
MRREIGREPGGRALDVKAKTSGQGAASGTDRRCVLLVEDNRNLRITTARMLEHLGYSVTAVDNGPAAVEAFRHGPAPDVTILDVGLPGMGGREVMGAIRAMAPGARVVLCSGAPEDLVVAAGAGGPTEMLVKPYDIEALSGVLKQILGS